MNVRLRNLLNAMTALQIACKDVELELKGLQFDNVNSLVEQIKKSTSLVADDAVSGLLPPDEIRTISILERERRRLERSLSTENPGHKYYKQIADEYHEVEEMIKRLKSQKLEINGIRVSEL